MGGGREDPVKLGGGRDIVWVEERGRERGERKREKEREREKRERKERRRTNQKRLPLIGSNIVHTSFIK